MTATTILYAIAGSLFLLFLYLQHLADVRAANYARKQQRLAEERKNTLSEVLSSAHHQMSRELAMLGMELDDLTASGAQTRDALDTTNRLAESRDSIAALAQLGQDEKWLDRTPVTAEQIAPDNGVLALSLETITPIMADRPMLRVALTSITRHLHQFGFTDLRLVVDGEELRITANRSEGSTRGSHEPVGTDNLAERVFAAHGAEVQVSETDLEWSLATRILAHSDDEIDLRPSSDLISAK